MPSILKGYQLPPFAAEKPNLTIRTTLSLFFEISVLKVSSMSKILTLMKLPQFSVYY